MGDGKKGLAPCGHEGEAVIGQYYECRFCDWDTAEFVLIACLSCKSLDIDLDFQVDPMFYFWNPGVPIVNTRCNKCGKVWTR